MSSLSYETFDRQSLPKDVVESMASLYWEDFVDKELRDENPEFYSLERFHERVFEKYSPRPGFRVVICREEDSLVGFSTSSNLVHGSPWWSEVVPQLSKDEATEDGARTLAIYDLMVKKSYRGKKIASQLHSLALENTDVDRVTLLSSKPQQPAHSMWLNWGYEIVGQKKFASGPDLDVFIRPMHDRG
jgi:GNAT superfamily N-acetyltransferase